tara:strand:+ start:68 stop:631 length:564 start_codon:yes stop_codon:yes gene_type:complete
MYGQIKDGNILGAALKNSGYKEISVVTAGDSSHTLAAADGGIVFISAALASGAVIKLPEATPENVGLEYNVVFGGTMAAAASIELPNAKDSLFTGVVHVQRCGNAAGVSDAAAQTVVETTIVCTLAQAEKALELDEDDETFGGGIGTDLTFSYVAENVVFVTGDIMVNVADTAIDALQATSFTGTGY